MSEWGWNVSSQMSRQDLYKKGGLLSITSQIFTVDMLTSDIPTHLITGILVLHAERYAHREVIKDASVFIPYSQCKE